MEYGVRKKNSKQLLDQQKLTPLGLRAACPSHLTLCRFIVHG